MKSEEIYVDVLVNEKDTLQLVITQEQFQSLLQDEEFLLETVREAVKTDISVLPSLQTAEEINSVRFVTEFTDPVEYVEVETEPQFVTEVSATVEVSSDIQYIPNLSTTVEITAESQVYNNPPVAYEAIAAVEPLYNVDIGGDPYIQENIVVESEPSVSAPITPLRNRFWSGRRVGNLSRPEEKLLLCEHCDYRTYNVGHFKAHNLKHTGEMPFFCKHCPYRSRQKSNLNRHAKLHADNGEQFTCALCQYFALSEAGLRRHMKLHDVESRTHRCPHCDFFTNNATHLRTHLRHHNGEYPYKCDVCSYETCQKSNLTRHKKRHEGGERTGKGGDMLRLCGSCDYRTSNSDHLKAHVRAAHTGELPYACLHCNYKSTQMSNLRRHLLKHTGKKPYSCHLCTYTTAYPYVLKIHLKQHSQNSLTCSICKKSAITVKELKRHIRMSHAKSRPGFACPLCKYWTTNTVHFKVHSRRHTGETPYHCNLCKYKSAQKSNLKRHMKISHTDRNPEDAILPKEEPPQPPKEGQAELEGPIPLAVITNNGDPSTAVENKIIIHEENYTSALEEPIPLAVITNNVDPSTAVENKIIIHEENYTYENVNEMKTSQEEFVVVHEEIIESSPTVERCEVMVDHDEVVETTEGGEVELETVIYPENEAEVVVQEIIGEDVEDYDPEAATIPFATEDVSTLPLETMDDSEIPVESMVIPGLEEEEVEVQEESKKIKFEILKSNYKDEFELEGDQEGFVVCSVLDIADTDEKPPVEDDKASLAESLAAAKMYHGSKNSPRKNLSFLNKSQTEELKQFKRLLQDVMIVGVKTSPNSSMDDCTLYSASNNAEDTIDSDRILCWKPGENVIEIKIPEKQLSSDNGMQNVHVCYLCGYSTKHLWELRNHSKRHPGETSFLCDKCPYRTAHEHNLRRHISCHHERHTVLKKPAHECSICNFKTFSKKMFEKHVGLHKPIPQIETCQICGFLTTKKERLRNHMKCHPQSSTSCPYECHYCGFRVRTKTKLRWHVDSHLVTLEGVGGDAVFECYTCGYQSLWRSHIDLHHRRHQKEEPESYTCWFCRLVTLNPELFKHHLTRHAEEEAARGRWLNCGYCDFSSVFPGQFLLHVTHHLETAPYLCWLCHYATAKRTNLKRHFRYKHPGVIEKLKEDNIFVNDTHELLWGRRLSQRGTNPIHNDATNHLNEGDDDESEKVKHLFEEDSRDMSDLELPQNETDCTSEEEKKCENPIEENNFRNDLLYNCVADDGRKKIDIEGDPRDETHQAVSSILEENVGESDDSSMKRLDRKRSRSNSSERLPRKTLKTNLMSTSDGKGKYSRPHISLARYRRNNYRRLISSPVKETKTKENGYNKGVENVNRQVGSTEERVPPVGHQEHPRFKYKINFIGDYYKKKIKNVEQIPTVEAFEAFNKAERPDPQSNCQITSSNGEINISQFVTNVDDEERMNGLCDRVREALKEVKRTNRSWKSEAGRTLATLSFYLVPREEISKGLDKKSGKTTTKRVSPALPAPPNLSDRGDVQLMESMLVSSDEDSDQPPSPGGQPAQPPHFLPKTALPSPTIHQSQPLLSGNMGRKDSTLQKLRRKRFFRNTKRASNGRVGTKSGLVGEVDQDVPSIDTVNGSV